MMFELEILDGGFTISKLNSWKDVPEGRFVFAAATDCEISLVCPSDIVPGDTAVRDDGWSAMRISGQLDFSLVGVLSRLSAVLAAERIGIFAVSTYDTDYILIKTVDLIRAKEALKKSGYSFKEKN